jgi:hypothetical protein
MVARVLAGESQDRLAFNLNQRGVTTSTGANWTRESLKQLLLRARNAGQVVHNGVVGHLPGERILDNETWEWLNTLYSRVAVAVRTLLSICARVSCTAGVVDVGFRGGRGRSSSRTRTARFVGSIGVNHVCSTADVVVSLLINVSWTGMSGRWW